MILCRIFDSWSGKIEFKAIQVIIRERGVINYFCFNEGRRSKMYLGDKLVFKNGICETTRYKLTKININLLNVI